MRPYRDSTPHAEALVAEGGAHHYEAFGLSIQSVLLLPELEPAECGHDVVIRFGPIDAPEDERSGRECTYVGGEDVHFAWTGVGRFLVHAGREIIIDPDPGASDASIRAQLLGPVLAMTLQQRGLLVLHGSAVASTDEALIFLGASGKGKSTTAAALSAQGFTLLADDIVAIDLASPEGPRLIPGLPAAQLWPDSASTMGVARSNGARDDRSSKLSFRRGIFQSEAIRVGCIYSLDVASDLACEQLPPSFRLIEIFDHSFGPVLLEFGLAQTVFQMAARLAASTPVKRLSRTQSLAHLSELIKLIATDVGWTLCPRDMEKRTADKSIG